MYDDAVLVYQKEIRRLRCVVREYADERRKIKELVQKAVEQRRSMDDKEDYLQEILFFMEQTDNE